MNYKEIFAKTLLKEININYQDLLKEIKICQNKEHGDLSFPVFQISKIYKKSPLILADEISKKITSDYFTFTSLNGYINAKIKSDILVKNTISEVILKKKEFGKVNIDNESYVIDTFNANPLKTLHVGHLRNIVTGDFVYNLLKFVGASPKPVSYGGDVGTHVSRWYWYYQKISEDEKKIPTKDVSKWFGKIYIESGKLLEENPEKYKEEIEKIQVDMISSKTLQEEVKSLALKSHQAYMNIAKELNVSIYDSLFESSAEKKFLEIKEDLFSKNPKTFIESDGAIVADLEDDFLKCLILIKQNGALLYGAKDIGLVKLKQEKNPDCKHFLYVVASEQEFYFKQLFKLFEIIYPNTKHYHISHGLVNTLSGKMKSREGVSFLYEDFRDEIFESVRNKLLENGLLDQEEIVKQISFGVIKFEMLKTNLNKNIVFDISSALDFQGDTAPYLQYSGVRVKSILNKSNFVEGNLEELDFNYNFEKEELLLCLKINEFKEKIEEAYKGYKPQTIVNYSLELCHLFNKFYASCPVLSQDDNLKNIRLFLIKCFLITLENSLSILGIEIPEKM